MTTLLTPGGIAQLKANNSLTADVPLICEVSGLKKLTESKYTCTFSDGKETIVGVLASQVSAALAKGDIVVQDGSRVQILDAICQQLGGEQKLLVTGLSAVLSAGAVLTNVETNIMADPKTPFGKSSMDASSKQALPKYTPGPTPSPSEEPPRSAGRTPGTGGRSRTNLVPIQAINPYESNWTIKAQVTQKLPGKAFMSKGQQSKLFTVELRDEQGTEIRGTFWREGADKYESLLQVEKVYYFSKFTVRMANKAYSNLRNDYELNFDGRTEVEECEAAESETFMATSEYQPSIVPIDQLPNYLTRKVTVDVMGVVTAVGALGTTKRKSDSTELNRRDLTIVDQSAKSVTITLWAENATSRASELEEKIGSVVLCTHCRVTDFGGCSLSTLSRSNVQIDPKQESAQALRDWYAMEGRAMTMEPIAASAPNAGQGRGSGQRAAELAFFKDIQPSSEAMPSADSPPVNYSITAHVVQIKPDQTLTYLAHPETGKKVVEQAPGSYYCEADGKYCAVAQNRYILSVRAQDCTGECFLNLFNVQGQTLLGMSADDLVRRKTEGGDEAYTALLKEAQWSEWSMVVSAKAREYNGETRMRYTVDSMHKVDYASQCQHLLGLIARIGA